MTAEVKAGQLRDLLGLGDQPAHGLPALIEEAGLAMVAVWPFKAEISGFMVKDPVLGRVIIALSASESPFRQRFTLAHELGHLAANDFRDCHSPGSAARAKERWADAFAGHFLAPRSAVAGLMARLGVSKGVVGKRELSAVVRHFEVSPDPARIALKAVGFNVSDEISTTAPQLATEFGWRADYEAMERESAVVRPPSALLSRMVEAYRQGDLSVTALARTRRISEEDMTQELEEAGIHPAEHDAMPFEFPG